MGIHVSLSIVAWAAWMPGVSTEEEWAHWAQGSQSNSQDEVPPSTYLPLQMRRRLSAFNKSTLLSVYKLDAELEHVRSVFASRHGDLHTAVALFEQLANHEKLSPVNFTRSVFNNSQGLFSIATQNRHPGTAVSGGRSSLWYALLEAATQLQSSDETYTLVNISDEPLPAMYQTYDKEKTPRYSLSLLLSRDVEGLLLQGFAEPDQKEPNNSEPLPLLFLRWLLLEQDTLEFYDGRLRWEWNRLSS